MYIMVFLSNQVFSQDYNLRFEYDDSGNRVQRWIEITQLKEIVDLAFIFDSLDISKEANHLKVLIYPNPTKGELAISLPLIENETVRYKLYDQQGHEVDKGSIYDPVKYLDLSKYMSGTYFLLLTEGIKSSVYKLIKL